jgi:hypothetical protein
MVLDKMHSNKPSPRLLEINKLRYKKIQLLKFAANVTTFNSGSYAPDINGNST